MFGMVHKSCRRDAPGNYEMPICGVQVRPLLEETLDRIEDERYDSLVVLGGESGRWFLDCTLKEMQGGPNVQYNIWRS